MTAVKFRDNELKNIVFLLAYDEPIYSHKYLVLEENKMHLPLISLAQYFIEFYIEIVLPAEILLAYYARKKWLNFKKQKIKALPK